MEVLIVLYKMCGDFESECQPGILGPPNVVSCVNLGGVLYFSASVYL